MKKTSSENKKVIVAMSGGIDSSVAAALLKEAGSCSELAEGSCPEPCRRVDVIGVFMKLDKLKSSSENERRAKAVAKKLGVSFRVLDFRKEFKEKVIKYFIKEYKKGRTPNPCVACNKEIKFKLLFKKISIFKADYIATGHYARIKEGRLLKGRDKNKDQSYFLWQLTPKLLDKVLFPVGGYTKTEVKRLGKSFDLFLKDISESQEICFIQTTINDFLKKHLKAKPGGIIDNKGKIIGRHQGLHFYTIGQRRGIELTGGPFYVLDKDIKRNLLIVTKNEKDLCKKELIAKNVNWISPSPLAKGEGLKIKGKIRYRHEAAPATLVSYKGGKIKVKFLSPQRAITPGQSVVFYKGEELLGGGIIT